MYLRRPGGVLTLQHSDANLSSVLQPTWFRILKGPRFEQRRLVMRHLCQADSAFNGVIR